MDIISSYSTVRKPSPNRLLRSLRAEEADNQHRCNGNRANGHKDGRNTKRGEHPTHHHRHQHIEQLGHGVREADAAEADLGGEQFRSVHSHQGSHKHTRTS